MVHALQQALSKYRSLLRESLTITSWGYAIRGRSQVWPYFSSLEWLQEGEEAPQFSPSFHSLILGTLLIYAWIIVVIQRNTARCLPGLTALVAVDNIAFLVIPQIVIRHAIVKWIVSLERNTLSKFRARLLQSNQQQLANEGSRT